MTLLWLAVFIPWAYWQSLSRGSDVNGDLLVNVQDIIVTVNFILANDYDSNADQNSDGSVNILDIVQIVNIILSN